LASGVEMTDFDRLMPTPNISIRDR